MHQADPSVLILWRVGLCSSAADGQYDLQHFLFVGFTIIIMRYMMVDAGHRRKKQGTTRNLDWETVDRFGISKTSNALHAPSPVTRLIRALCLEYATTTSIATKRTREESWPKKILYG